MAVVTNLSAQLTNAYSQPVILSNPYVAGGNDINEVANVVAGATDSAGSLYKYCRLPSNARIQDVQIQNDANAAGVSYKLGVYSTVPNGGVVPVPYADQILFSGVSMATARAIWTSAYNPAILNGTGSAANVEKRIWELLGLTADPCTVYDLVLTAVTPGTAGGNMALLVSYVR